MLAVHALIFGKTGLYIDQFMVTASIGVSLD